MLKHFAAVLALTFGCATNTASEADLRAEDAEKAAASDDGRGCGTWWFPDWGCADAFPGTSCLEGPDYFSDQETESYCRPIGGHRDPCVDSDDCASGFLCQKENQVGYGSCIGPCGDYGAPCY